MANDRSKADKLIDAAKSDLPTLAETGEGPASHTAALAEQLDPNIAQAIAINNSFVIEAIRGGARTNDQILQALLDANVQPGDLPPGLQTQYEELRQRQNNEQQELSEMALRAARKAEAESFASWASAVTVAAVSNSGSGGSSSSSNYSKMSDNDLASISAQQWGKMSAAQRTAAVNTVDGRIDTAEDGYKHGLSERMKEMDARYANDPATKAKIMDFADRFKDSDPDKAIEEMRRAGLDEQAIKDAMEVIKLRNLIKLAEQAHAAADEVRRHPNDQAALRKYKEAARHYQDAQHEGRRNDTAVARMEHNTHAMRHTDNPEERRALREDSTGVVHAARRQIATEQHGPAQSALAYHRIATAYKAEKEYLADEGGNYSSDYTGRALSNELSDGAPLASSAASQSSQPNAQQTITVDPRMKQDLVAIGASPDDASLDPTTPAVAAKPAAPAHTQTA